MAAQEFDRAPTRMLLDGLQERDHPARVVSGAPHYLHPERIGLLLSRPAVFKQHRIQAEPAYRAHHLTESTGAPSAEQASDQSQSCLSHVSLRSLICSVAQTDVSDLVSDHGRDFILVPGGLQRPAIDVDEPARQGECVDRIVVHDSELIWISDARSVGRKPLSYTRHPRVGVSPQLPVGRRRRSPPDLVILLW